MLVIVWIVFVATLVAGGRTVVRGALSDPSTGAPPPTLRERFLDVEGGRRLTVLAIAAAAVTVAGLVVALLPEAPTHAAPVVWGVGYLGLAVYGIWWGAMCSRAAREREELRRRFDDIVAPLRGELRP